MSVFNSRSEEALTGIRWFALHVHARKESFVAAQLENQGIECFLPRYKSFRKWSDRMKEVELPLFPSYLFSRFDFQRMKKSLQFRQPFALASRINRGPSSRSEKEFESRTEPLRVLKEFWSISRVTIGWCSRWACFNVPWHWKWTLRGSSPFESRAERAAATRSCSSPRPQSQ